MTRDDEDAALEELMSNLDRTSIGFWRLIHAFAERERFVYDAIGEEDVRDAYFNVTGKQATEAELRAAFRAFKRRHALGLIRCDVGELEEWLRNDFLSGSR